MTSSLLRVERICVSTATWLYDSVWLQCWKETWGCSCFPLIREWKAVPSLRRAFYKISDWPCRLDGSRLEHHLISNICAFSLRVLICTLHQGANLVWFTLLFLSGGNRIKDGTLWGCCLQVHKYTILPTAIVVNGGGWGRTQHFTHKTDSEAEAETDGEAMIMLKRGEKKFLTKKW